MHHSVRRWALALAFVTGGSFLFSPAARCRAADAPAAPQQVASVDELKSEAFRALRGSQFAKTNELLARAATLSADPQLQKMAGWTKAFETQREEFAADRQKQFEKSVGDVKLLQGKEKPDFAFDFVARSYLLAPDKKAFRAEAWVDALTRQEIARAEQYDKAEQWVKALRIYSDLSTIEPAQPLWKERLKLATRRVRLLVLYTPDVLKKQQEGDSKERDAVEAILQAAATQPSTRPANRPSTQPADGEETFKTDWRETLRGVTMDILKVALVDARENYFRETSYRDLALGGLNGLRAVVTTRGLEQAFPRLAEDQRRLAFVAALDELVAKNKAAVPATEMGVMRDTLARLRAANTETVGLPEEVLVSEFADGAFAELDMFTSMIWPSDMEEFKKTTQGEFSGVGIQIVSDDLGYLKVVTPIEDSPAYKAGIKPDDLITHINGKSAKNISTTQAVKYITGERGTTVVLTVKSTDGKVKEYALRRDTIHVASIKGWMHKPNGGWDWFVDPENRIAYMRLKSFTPDTAKELDKAIDQIKAAKGRGLILDLRNNPGGLLTSAIEVCDKFLSEGVIVSTHPDRDTGNPATVAKAQKDADDVTDLPLIVLVHQFSASASEIVSGCLKDHRRALIVGERTYGKGSVQMLFTLAGRTAQLKLTTSHYYLPNGKCIHREENSTEWGVDPDVTVEMTPKQMQAAIDARDSMDVLRDDPSPAQGEVPKLKTTPADPKDAAEGKVAKKDLLSSDPQLSAALLLLRLQLAGAQI